MQMNFIFSDNVHILRLSCHVSNLQKQRPNYLRRAETSIVLIVFYGDLYEVRVPTVTVYYNCST